MRWWGGSVVRVVRWLGWLGGEVWFGEDFARRNPKTFPRKIILVRFGEWRREVKPNYFGLRRVGFEGCHAPAWRGARGAWQTAVPLWLFQLRVRVVRVVRVVRWLGGWAVRRGSW